MYEIKPTIFTITKEEVEEIVQEMREDKTLGRRCELNKEQIVSVLEYVECDEMLAKDINMSIRSSICEVLKRRRNLKAVKL